MRDMKRNLTGIVATFGMLGIGLLLPAASAWGQHADVDIVVTAGQLATEGGVFTTGSFADRVFEGELAPGTPNNTTIEPGFDALAGTLQSGDQVRFDFVQQLLYWNGTALTAPPSSLSVSLGGSSRTISGTDTSGLAGFLVATAGPSGGFHQDLTWSLPNTAADGLYGVVLTLGPEAGTTGFTTSDPFVIGFVNGTVADVEGGLAAMANVALVPEPSSVALALAGAAGVAAGGRRRRRVGMAWWPPVFPARLAGEGGCGFSSGTACTADPGGHRDRSRSQGSADS